MKAIAGLMPRLVKPLFLAVFVIPSVLFWSSGVIKETFLVFALGLLIWLVFGALGRRVKGWLLLLIVPLSTLLYAVLR